MHYWVITYEGKVKFYSLDRKCIRIQAANIYVENKLHGKVCNLSFTLLSELSSPNNNSATELEVSESASAGESSAWLHNISACPWNACSLINQLNSFQSYILSCDFDLIAITETWLSNSTLNGEILSSNYTIYRRDRASRGGGVLLAVKDHLSSKLQYSSDVIGSIVVEIYSTRSFIICIL